MPVLEPNRVDPDEWYGYHNNDAIFCGECMNEELKLTETGKRVGDERTTMDMIYKLEDADEQPYQCDMCNLQNEAYDDVDSGD